MILLTGRLVVAAENRPAGFRSITRRSTVVLIYALLSSLSVGCGGTLRSSGQQSVNQGLTSTSQPQPSPPATAPNSTDSSVAAAGATPARPPIIWDPIPFPPKRKAEMADYSERHYGSRDWKLDRPRVIVEHLTQSSTFEPVLTMFSQDTPDNELHELPGVCAHFVIDQNGVIHQLVPLSVMCRHTVGLNWTAIGIEHVGFVPADVLYQAKIRSASLRLTNWLRCREGIAVKNVIGHNESLQSPYHHERVVRLRGQTHDDFPTQSMDKYRAALGRLSC